jgi:hypothetical protein
MSFEWQGGESEICKLQLPNPRSCERIGTTAAPTGLQQRSDRVRSMEGLGHAPNA